MIGSRLAAPRRPGRHKWRDRDSYLTHDALKPAFHKLYGYSSDEEGVRHALVFGDEAQVDEADALFMLGACAS